MPIPRGCRGIIELNKMPRILAAIYHVTNEIGPQPRKIIGLYGQFGPSLAGRTVCRLVAPEPGRPPIQFIQSVKSYLVSDTG